MRRFAARGRINVRVLIIVLLVLLLGGGGTVGLHYYKKGRNAKQALALGRAAFAKKEWDKAASQLLIYLQANREDAAVLRQYAEANLRRGPNSLPAAVDAYRRILKQKPGDLELCRQLTRLYVQAGGKDNYTEALYIGDQCPNDKVVRLWRAKAMIGLGQRDKARDELAKLKSEDPHNPEIYLSLCTLTLLDRTGKSVPVARSILDDAVKNCPTSPEALLQRAKFHRMVAGDLTKEAKIEAARTEKEAGRADLDAVDTMKPRNSRVRLAMAEEWREFGDYKKAHAELEAFDQCDASLLEAEDTNFEDLELPRALSESFLVLREEDAKGAGALAQRLLGRLKGDKYNRFLPMATRLYLLADNVAAARKCATEFKVKLKPRAGTPVAHESTMIDARVTQAEQRPFEAIQMYTGLLSARSRDTEALMGLWRCYRDVGEKSLGIRWLQEYVARVPNDYAALVELAAWYGTREFTKAANLALAAKQIKNNGLEANLLLIQAALAPALEHPELPSSMDMFKNVRKELDKFKADLPDVGSIPSLLATMDEAQGRTDEAEKELRHAVGTCKKPLNEYMQLADLLYRHKRTDDAIAAAREATSKMAESPEAWLKLADLLRQAGKAAEAEAALQQASEHLSEAGKLRTQLMLAELLISQKKEDDGKRMLESMCREFPRQISPRLALLALPDLQKNADAAQQIVDQVKAIEGEDGVHWKCEQASVWLRSKKGKEHEDDLIRKLGDCIDADPLWQQPVLLLGAFYESLGDPEKAIQTYRGSLDSSTSNVAVANRLLELLEKQQRYSDAAEVLNRLSGKLNDTSHAISVALGREDYASAARELLRRVTADSKDGASRIVLARLVYDRRRDERIKKFLSDMQPPVSDAVAYAMKLLDEAEAATTDAIGVATIRAQILRSENRADEALAMINELAKKRTDFTPYLLRAQHYAATGKLELAEKDFDLMTALPTAPPDAFVAAVQFLRATKKMDKAITCLNTAAARFPDNDGIKGELMQTLLGMDDARQQKRGKEILEELLKRNPNSPPLLMFQVRNLLVENTAASRKAANDQLEKIVRIAPRMTQAHLLLITMAAQQGDRPLADRLMARAIAASPDDGDLLVRKAEMEVEAKRPIVARSTVEIVMRKPAGTISAQTRVAAHVLAARLDQAAGKTQEAIADLENLANTDAGKQFASIWMTLSDLYRFKGDLVTAEKRFHEAEKISPNSDQVLLGTMQFFATHRDYAGLVKWLTEHREKHPDDFVTQLGGAALLSGVDDPAYAASARGIVEGVLKNHPKALQAYFVLATLTYRAKDYDATSEVYRRLLAIDPNNTEGLNDLAWILAEDKHDLEAGLKLADQGLAAEPNNIHLLDTRGVILMQLERLSDAQRDLQKCVLLSQDTPQTQGKALIHLARVKIKRGFKREALADLEQAKNLEKAQIELKVEIFGPAERAEIEDLGHQAR